MRNYSSSNVKIEYPSYLVWLLDNNFIHCINVYGAYKLVVSIIITAGGVVTTYEHTTEIGDITFRLSPYLRGLPSGTACDVLVQTKTYDSHGNSYIDTEMFKMKYVYGKSLQERHHGSESVVAYERLADLNPLELLKPEGWTGFIKFGANIQSFGGTDADIAAINCVFPGPVRVDYTGTGGPIYRGDVWDESLGSSWNVRCVQVCPPRNGIKLTYYNTDGCKRYAIGEVLKKTMASERKEYRQGGVVYDEPPRSLVTGYAGTIDVGFSDVEPGQYLEDIMLSPVVTTTRGADTINVIPTTLQMVRDGETKDIIITFKIDA